jgi:hypothetical protein
MPVHTLASSSAVPEFVVNRIRGEKKLTMRCCRSRAVNRMRISLWVELFCLTGKRKARWTQLNPTGESAVPHRTDSRCMEF